MRVNGITSLDAQSGIQNALALEDSGRSEMPSRPRFVQELVAVPLEGGIAIEGAERFLVLRGEAWKNAFPKLSVLLDGARSLDQIQAALPEIPREHVREAVSTLYGLGIVEDGAKNEAEFSVNPETLSFFRRFHGPNQNATAACKELRTSDVVIVHNAHATKEIEALASVLERSGVGRLTLLNQDSLISRRSFLKNSNGKSIILAMSFGAEDCESYTKLDDWCAENGVSWLRVVLDERRASADLGPLFKSGENPCYRCFLKVHSGASSSQVPVRKAAGHAAAYVFASLVAIEILYWITGIGRLATGRDFQRYDLSNWTSNRLCWPFIPGCPRCRPLELGGLNTTDSTRNADWIETAVLYEDYVGLQSRPIPEAQTPSSGVAQVAPDLTYQAKRLQNCREIPLDRGLPSLSSNALAILSKDGVISSGALTLNDLGALLLLTAGIRTLRPHQNKLERWAATAGNLGSVELFLAIRHVEGLEPGFYFYQSHEHSLAHFQRRHGALEIQDFMRHVIFNDQDHLPDALVLFTGAFHRVAQKYGAFGYRLTNLDAGAAVSQSLLVASSLGIQSNTVAPWPDRLIEDQLNLEPCLEQSTAVVALHGGKTTRSLDATSGLTRWKVPVGTPPVAKAPDSFKELTTEQVVELLYRESRVGQLEPQDKGCRGVDERANPVQDKPVLLLPSPISRGSSVASILEQRRSIRHYASDPLSLGQLSTMLRCAYDGDANDWPEEHHSGQQLEFLVFANRVGGANPAVYLYNDTRRGLSLFAQAPAFSEMVEAFVQSEFASAPLFVWIVGDLRAACKRHGAFGHRLLLLRAGAAAHRLWLGALSVGLSGCLIAGLIPGAGRRRFGLDGYKRASLIGFTAGYRAEYAG